MNRYLAELLGCGVPEVYDRLEDLLNQILPKKPLHAYGVTEADLEEFTRSVMETQGRLMGNNFVLLEGARVVNFYCELYYSAVGGRNFRRPTAVSDAFL